MKEQQLYWWARSDGAKKRRPAGRMRLVEAIPMEAELEASAPSNDPSPRWSWELAGAGAVLRGSDLDASTLLVLMAAVTAVGRR